MPDESKITVSNSTATSFAIGRFLGSMNLAIILLVAVAIASVIGTILRQNETYQDYIIKFGPFWHEVYKSLGLYDVYSSLWFIAIIGFLVISTGICVARNAPAILRSMRRFREDIQIRSLNNMPDNTTWQVNASLAEVRQKALRFLRQAGYRVKTREGENALLLAAKRGSSNRLGYLLTHIAIVVIGISGLLDSNLPLKLRLMQGQLDLETRDISVSEIPEKSRLSADNPSFRASVSIPEGARINYAFINLAAGYLLQALPFSIEVRDFRVEHYPNGQPRSFETDLVLNDGKTNESLTETIAVNHPLFYKGYAIYQSSFADGGSRLKLSLHRFFDSSLSRMPLEGVVNKQAELTTDEGPLSLEFTGFRKFNIFPAPPEMSGKKFIDYGPSFNFKLRRPDGSAREYINYMYAVPIDDRLFFISGIRSSPADDFLYLHLPADNDNSLKRFMRFHARLYNDAKMETLSRQAAKKIISGLGDEMAVMEEDVRDAMLQLVKLFRDGGFDAVATYAGSLSGQEDIQATLQPQLKILRALLYETYLDVLEEEDHGKGSPDGMALLFFEDAMEAFNALHLYGSPFYLQLTDFEHKEASGLQITRTPGKKFVYLGFAMLITGVFLLFYVHHRRIWLYLETGGTRGTTILMAGNGTRHRHEFRRYFNRLVIAIKQALQ